MMKVMSGDERRSVGGCSRGERDCVRKLKK